VSLGQAFSIWFNVAPSGALTSYLFCLFVIIPGQSNQKQSSSSLTFASINNRRAIQVVKLLIYIGGKCFLAFITFLVVGTISITII
jgi:hypothetical protein